MISFRLSGTTHNNSLCFKTMVVDEEFGERITKKLDSYFGAKKTMDFHKAFVKFERVADRLIKQGRGSEVSKSPEALAVKKFMDQTESEFYAEMRQARISNTKLAFDVLLLRRMEAYSAERKAKRSKK